MKRMSSTVICQLSHKITCFDENRALSTYFCVWTLILYDCVGLTDFTHRQLIRTTKTDFISLESLQVTENYFRIYLFAQWLESSGEFKREDTEPVLLTLPTGNFPLEHVSYAHTLLHTSL